MTARSVLYVLQTTECIAHALHRPLYILQQYICCGHERPTSPSASAYSVTHCCMSDRLKSIGICPCLRSLTVAPPPPPACGACRTGVGTPTALLPLHAIMLSPEKPKQNIVDACTDDNIVLVIIHASFYSIWGGDSKNFS